MSQLYTYFTASSASTGSVFYPEHFLVATVASGSVATEAAQAVGGDGVRKEDLIAVSSGEMLDFFKEFRSRAGALGRALRALSRFIDTEVKYADADIENATHGHGFVVVRCETAARAQRVASLLAPFHPTSVQFYRADGVESLV